MKQLFLILLNAGIFHLLGQTQFGSLEEILEFADKNAISVQTSLQNELIATSENNASKWSLLPSVNASAGFNDNITLQPTLVPANMFNPAAPEGTFEELTFGRKYLYSTGIQVNWDLLNFRKWFEIKTTKAALELHKANTLHTKFQLYNQLAEIYFSILLTQKYLGINKKNLSAADSIYLITLHKYSTGIFSEENLNRSKIQKLQTEQQINSLTYQLEQLYNQLQQLLNTRESIRLNDNLSEPKILAGIDLSAAHPDVLVQESQVKLSEQQLVQTKLALYPSLSLGYQYNFSMATDRLTDFSDANNLPQQFLGMKLSIPVFNGAATLSKIHQSKIRLENQQMILENKKLLAQKEDENLQNQFRSNLEDVNKQQEVLQLQEQNDRYAQNRYERGVIGPDERLNKFQDLLRVQNQYMQSLSNQYICYYKLYIRKRFN